MLSNIDYIIKSIIAFNLKIGGGNMKHQIQKVSHDINIKDKIYVATGYIFISAIYFVIALIGIGGIVEAVNSKSLVWQILLFNPFFSGLFVKGFTFLYFRKERKDSIRFNKIIDNISGIYYSIYVIYFVTFIVFYFYEKDMKYCILIIASLIMLLNEFVTPVGFDWHQMMNTLIFSEKGTALFQKRRFIIFIALASFLLFVSLKNELY